MAVVVTHTAVAPLSGGAKISSAEWNDGHTVPVATQAQAEAGTDNTTLMTPLRSAQALAALAPAQLTQAQAENPASTVFGTISGQRLNQETKAALNVAGSAPMFACRAWVNFNGTGTVAILASGNVSSITDDGVGQYTINFTTAMQDANYSWTGACNSNTTAVDNRSVVGAKSDGVKTASALQILTTTGKSGTLNVDVTDVCVAVFR